MNFDQEIILKNEAQIGIWDITFTSMSERITFVWIYDSTGNSMKNQTSFLSEKDSA